MNELERAWWQLARSAGEIAWIAPLVVQQRSARLMQPRAVARTRDRREAVRMVSEKWESGLAAQAALWQNAWRMQQRLIEGYWTAALGPGSPRRRTRSLARRGALELAVLAQSGLAPVARRVRGNARRLRGGA